MNASRCLVLTLAILAAAQGAAAQDVLVSVRALYASAVYEEALTAIGRLKSDPESAAVPEVDQFRVLCLMALGRSGEADQVIEKIVAGDPTYQPDGDSSPRVRAAYTVVRRRVLPSVTRGLYAEGKAAFDRKDFKQAIQKLETTLSVIDNPDTSGHPELADLRTLASGFLELSRASLPPVVAPTPAPAVAAVPAPAPPTLMPPTDPVVLKQDLPPWSIAVGGALFEAEFRGLIEVEIDETGNVTMASIIQPTHPGYDRLLLKAAREWKYEPARRNGQPVKVTKRVDIVLRPRPRPR